MEKVTKQMQNNSEIVIYQSQDGQAKLDVRLEGETVWLTQDQMAELFDRDRTAINRHINNIFAEGELDKNVVCANFAHTTLHGAIEGKTQTTKTPNKHENNNEYKKQKNIMKNKFNFKSIILTFTLLTLGVGEMWAI